MLYASLEFKCSNKSPCHVKASPIILLLSHSYTPSLELVGNFSSLHLNPVFYDTYMTALTRPGNTRTPQAHPVCYGSRHTSHKILPTCQFNESKTLACPVFLYSYPWATLDPHFLSKQWDFMSHNGAFNSLYKIFFSCSLRWKGQRETEMDICDM